MPTRAPSETTTETMEELHPLESSRPSVSLPVFAEPTPRRRSKKTTPPPLSLVEEEETGEQILTTGPSVRKGRVVGSASSSRADTLTEDSSTGSRPTPAQARNTSKLVKGLLKILIVASEALLKRTGRELRRPEEHQIDGVARPLAKIAVRHLDVSYISEDLMDLTEAGGALSDYILEGPVAPRINYVEQVGFPIDPAEPAPVINNSAAQPVAQPSGPQRETPPEAWLMAESPVQNPGVTRGIPVPNNVTYKS